MKKRSILTVCEHFERERNEEKALLYNLEKRNEEKSAAIQLRLNNSPRSRIMMIFQGSRSAINLISTTAREVGESCYFKACEGKTISTTADREGKIPFLNDRPRSRRTALFQGSRSSRKRSILTVCEHFENKHNVERGWLSGFAITEKALLYNLEKRNEEKSAAIQLRLNNSPRSRIMMLFQGSRSAINLISTTAREVGESCYFKACEA